MFKPQNAGDMFMKLKVIKILDFGPVVEYQDAPGNETIVTHIRTRLGTYRKCYRCGKYG